MAKKTNNNGASLGFEAELFGAADKLRGNMEPSDYKHVALGLIFLKHISDSFEAKHTELLAEYPEGAEDPDGIRRRECLLGTEGVPAGLICGTVPSSRGSAS